VSSRPGYIIRSYLKEKRKCREGGKEGEEIVF
jgi:hypothetical protein